MRTLRPAPTSHQASPAAPDTVDLAVLFVPMHGTALEHGIRANGCGPRTPFAQTKPKHPSLHSLQRQVRYRLHNVCGLRDDTFRRAYFRHARVDCLCLLETNCCTAAKELDWAAEWGGLAFWASHYRDPSSQHAGSHRGVAILLRGDMFTDVSVIARDPRGRFLAISLNVYSRPTLLIAGHADCGSPQTAYFTDLAAALPTPSPTYDVHLLLDTNNHTLPIDCIRYSTGHHAPPPYTPNNPNGSAALHALTVRLGGLTDAYRCLHPTTPEYTYITHHHGNPVC